MFVFRSAKMWSSHTFVMFININIMCCGSDSVQILFYQCSFHWTRSLIVEPGSSSVPQLRFSTFSFSILCIVIFSRVGGWGFGYVMMVLCWWGRRRRREISIVLWIRFVTTNDTLIPIILIIAAKVRTIYKCTYYEYTDVVNWVFILLFCDSHCCNQPGVHSILHQERTLQFANRKIKDLYEVNHLSIKPAHHMYEYCSGDTRNIVVVNCWLCLFFILQLCQSPCDS